MITMIRAELATLVTLVTTLAPSIAAADRTWHLAGGYVVHPGGALSGDIAWRVSDRLRRRPRGVDPRYDARVAAHHDRTGRHPRARIACGVSLSSGYTHAVRAKWDTFGHFPRIGASLTVRYGVLANGRVTIGAEVNRIPEPHLERLHDDVDLGGFIVGLFVGVGGG